MAATLVRKVMLKIAADDGDTEEKLDKIGKKADELAEKHPDLKVRIDTAAASAKLAVLRQELKKTDQQASQSGGSSSGLKKFGLAVANLFNTAGLGGVGGGFGEMTTFQKVMAGLNIATGLGEPLVAGLTVAVGGLGAGLVSGGLGLGVFGLAAKSAFSQVTAANTAGVKLKGGLGELQQGLAKATGEWNQFGKAASPGVARVMAGALKLIPEALKLAQPFLAPTEAALTKITGMLGKAAGSSGAKSWFGAFAKDSGTDIEKVAVAVGHIAVGLGGLLKAFLPESGKMLSGLDKITGAFAKWGTTLTGHSGFQSLMSMFKQDTPLVTGILRSLAGIIKTVVGQMTDLSTFSNSRMLLQLAGPVLQFANALLKAHPGLVELVLYLKVAQGSFKKTTAAVKGVSGAISDLQTAKKSVSDFSAGFSDSAKAADKATGAAGTYGGQMSKILQKLGFLKVSQAQATVATEAETAATGEATEAQEGLNTSMSLNPIGLIVIAIAALVIAFVELWKHSAAFRDFWKTALKDVEKAGVAAWHFVDSDMLKPLMTGIDKLVTFVKGHWKLLATILATVLLGPIAGLVVFIATHWSTFRRITSEVVNDVAGFFEKLPGRITGALASLPGLMLSAGKKIVSMLVSGITSMASAPAHAIEGIVGDVRNFLPFSPAKKGPLSGSGSPDIAGRKIALMLRDGMTSGAPEVSEAAARIGKAAQIAAAADRSGLAAAGGQPLKLQFEWVNGGGADQQFLTWLKKNIRIKGGDATVLGR